MYADKVIRVGGSLTEIVGGCCRCLMKVFNSGSGSYGKTYAPSIIASTCGPLPNATISVYEQESSRNGQAPSVWWYFITFSANITFYSGVLSLISSVMPLVCCLLTKLVPDFLNLSLMYFIGLSRV